MKKFPFFQVKGKTYLRVHVIPQAARARIGDIREGPRGEKALILYVTAPPVEGKANEAALYLLSQYFHIARHVLTVYKGTHQRNKIIAVPEELLAWQDA
ncbi:MAG: DUF167 domain-containing protein [Holosporales bacterium]|jgi:uncharacterized protein YggU (UPF0235/DUF167 family)|nr:DUF167 domain-containing protein [Holosporales bacterium]